MKVSIIQEAGYEAALLGLGLSYGKTSNISFEKMKYEHAEKAFHGNESCSIISGLYKVATKLAHKQGGHNKFLESIMVWVDVTAPLYWWKQADTYRTSTKQSESTMHTIMKRKLGVDDFEGYIVINMNDTVENINKLISKKDFDAVNALLPQSFLQRRIWCMSYKTLQNIFIQRNSHKLKEWHYFCDEVIKQSQHPEFLIKDK